MMESQLKLDKEGAPPAPASKLVLLDQDGETAWPLADEFVLGRAGDLRLGDARVSRRHARVYQEGGVYLVTDMGSSNGTFLNEEKLDGPRPVSNGDVIRVGPFKMRFEQDAPPAAPPQPIQQAMPPAGGALPTLSEGSSGPTVTLTLGTQTLTLPVGDHLALGDTLEVGEQELHGAGCVLVRRTDGHWLEPVPGKGRVLLNGNGVSVPARLNRGDRVSLGSLELEYKA